jgi:hypothetical protein
MTPNSTTSQQSAPVPPTWLPSIIPFGGDWDTFVRSVYDVFTRDFKRCPPRFRSVAVWHDQRVDSTDKYKFEEGFWHLVTRDQLVWDPKTRQNRKQRLTDIQRAERVPWARPIIGNERAAGVVAWDFDHDSKRGHSVRTYIWLKEHDYVVILEKQIKQKCAVFMLITGFYVRHEGDRRDLQSRYDRRRK